VSQDKTKQLIAPQSVESIATSLAPTCSRAGVGEQRLLNHSLGPVATVSSVHTGHAIQQLGNFAYGLCEQTAHSTHMSIPDSAGHLSTFCPGPWRGEHELTWTTHAASSCYDAKVACKELVSTRNFTYATAIDIVHSPGRVKPPSDRAIGSQTALSH